VGRHSDTDDFRIGMESQWVLSSIESLVGGRLTSERQRNADSGLNGIRPLEYNSLCSHLALPLHCMTLRYSIIWTVSVVSSLP